jgi:micrococcal nuclease
VLLASWVFAAPGQVQGPAPVQEAVVAHVADGDTVFLPDGTNLSREMVRQGLAHVYTVPPNMRFREELLEAQREAIKAHRGVWLEALKQTESSYIGNRRSLLFHRPTCHLGQNTARSNRVQFKSPTEAYLEGYSPCRTCKP